MMKESIRKILKETLIESYYDRDKLYSKSYIDSVMKRAPKNLKMYFKNLEEFDCIDKNNQPHTCVKIPEVIHTFIIGKY